MLGMVVSSGCGAFWFMRGITRIVSLLRSSFSKGQPVQVVGKSGIGGNETQFMLPGSEKGRFKTPFSSGMVSSEALATLKVNKGIQAGQKSKVSAFRDERK